MVHNQSPTAPLPSAPQFRDLDTIIIALDNAPRGPRRTLLKLRKRWIERAAPAFVPQQRTEAR